MYLIIFISILILLICLILINEFIFPIPLHRSTKYRVIKSVEIQRYGSDYDRSFKVTRYIIQRKLLLFYFEFDITACRRKDGELDYFGNQKDYNSFENLENAIEFIERYKKNGRTKISR